MYPDNLRIFMIYLGCGMNGRITEQHDIFFGVGESIDDLSLHAQIKSSWPDAKNLHIDGYKIIRQVGDYTVRVHRKADLLPPNGAIPSNKTLFFANAGFYLKSEEGESHKWLLLVLDDISEVKPEAMKHPFFKSENMVNKSPVIPHRDNEIEVLATNGKKVADVDDQINVESLLKEYTVMLYKHVSDQEDEWVHLGFYPVQK